jgi:hypothetical protein
MISMNTKTKWMAWAIVVLFLLNAATLGTILYHNYKGNPSAGSTVVAGHPGAVINGRFFRQTLGFTNEQMESFRTANHQFRPQTAAITVSIDSLKAAMFREMKRQAPDTVKLDALSKQIGELHGALKRETYRFYLNIRSVCSEQQADQLQKVFEPLFINENLPMAPGGNRRGWNKANH